MKQFNSLFSLWHHNTEKHSQEKAIGWIEKNKLQSMNFSEYRKTILKSILHLRAEGVEPGDRIAILSNTSKEWHFFDLAVQFLGGIVIPLYPTLGSEELDFICEDAKVNHLLYENDSLKKKLSAHTLEKMNFQMAFDEKQADPSMQKWRELEFDSEQEKEIIESIDINPKAIATVVYTAAITGNQRGAAITHEAIIQMCLNIKSSLSNLMTPDETNLVWLPLSHVFGRCDSFLCPTFGMFSVYSRGIDKVILDLKVVNPTFMLSVPRIFEKVHERIMLKLSKEKKLTQKVFQWGNSFNKTMNMYRGPFGNTLRFISNEALRSTLFKAIIENLGGRMRFMISGGAPLSKELSEFFMGLGIPILEGYGLTETVAPCSVNFPDDVVPGTIGKPIGDVQMKLADDDEILIKTKAMLTEYLNQPEDTKEAIIDGWFHSGDLGAKLPNGYYKIIGRKKEIIITSAGKNVAPKKIEVLLHASELIDRAVIIGDKRKFLSAMIIINQEIIKERLKLSDATTMAEMAQNPVVKNLISVEIEKANESLGRFEKIKKFFICESDFSKYIAQSGKTKKHEVFKDFAPEIERLYQANV